MSRRPRHARSLWFLAAGCLLVGTALAADEIEILELSPAPPASLDGIAPAIPITATASNSVTAVVRYRLDGPAARIEVFPRVPAGPAAVGFILVPPTSTVPACGPISGPSAGRCAVAFGLRCSPGVTSPLTIEQVNARMFTTGDVALATDSEAPARYTFRCPGTSPSPSSSCTVIGIAGAPGETPLPFVGELPICRCLRDDGARELRCALLHPDFFAVRRVPIPLIAGQPFKERWEFLALTRLDGPVKVTITGAGLADQVRHSFGVAGRKPPGKVERLVLEGMAPEGAKSMPGQVEFVYEMKDATGDIARAFRVDRTIEVGPDQPR